MRYIGMSEGSFKQKYIQHKSDVNSADKYKGVTKLAKHMWDLKEMEIQFKVTWSM